METRFAEVLDRLNLETEELGGEPLFVKNGFDSFDLSRSFDFRDWPVINARNGWGPRTIPAAYADCGALHIPPSRIRVVGEYHGKLVHECYEPVYAACDSTDLATIASFAGRGPVIKEWKLTYRLHDWEWCTCSTATFQHVPGGLWHPVCGRWKQSRVEGPIGEHILSLHLAPEDDATYNGFYPTLPGPDVAHYREGGRGMEAHQGGPAIRNRTTGDGLLRGGTEIRGGRAEHRLRTRGFVEAGPGYTKHVERLARERKEKQKQANRERVERLIAQFPKKPWDL